MAAAMNEQSSLVRLHLRIGWWMLLGFLACGIVLEALHGFKIGFYLNADRVATRQCWTITHSAGTVLGLVHIGFAAALFITPGWKGGTATVTSACLNSASILFPATFFVAGCFPSDESARMLVLLVPPGLLLLLFAIFQLARGVSSAAK